MDCTDNRKVTGRAVYEMLADTYRQLYIRPSADGEAKYRAVVECGEEPEEKSLSHFRMNELDSAEYDDTPAGAVMVVSLHEREDFDTFMRIMAHKCTEAVIPRTQGASILDGVINWRKIENHRDEFIEEQMRLGNIEPDWDSEFDRFTSDKQNYRDAIIVLSAGPYSNVSADRVGMNADEWLKLSYTIRRYHECTHFICRRLYHDKIDKVWDELVADAVGIYAALGYFDEKMARVFLGIEDDRYVSGRLENYVTTDDETEKRDMLEKLAKRIIPVFDEFRKMTDNEKKASPFDIAVMLEETIDRLWNSPGI